MAGHPAATDMGSNGSKVRFQPCCEYAGTAPQGPGQARRWWRADARLNGYEAPSNGGRG